jgi:pSer/pThr/pTyr-binding forkhead associated (FHA) protein
LSENSVDLFSESCGATGPLVVSVREPERSESSRLVFTAPFLIAGCHQEADLSLINGEISPHHCYLQTISGRVFCVDLGSRSGVFVDGARRPAFWVRRSQTIQIGPVDLRLEGGDRAEDESGAGPRDELSPFSARYAQEQSLPGVVLEFSIPGKPNRRWRMGPALALVGRSAACQVRLAHSSVSNFHCSLLRTPRGLWVVDLLSSSGLQVNGARQRHALLGDGDALPLGCFTVRLHCDPAPNRRVGLSAPEALGARSPAALSGPGRLPATEGKCALGTASTDPVLGTLLDHFAVIQQQTADQFQLSLLMLAQMFSTMHHDHMTVVREKLEQIRQLTEEMHALREVVATRWPDRADVTAPNVLVAGPGISPAPMNPKSTRAPSLEAVASHRNGTGHANGVATSPADHGVPVADPDADSQAQPPRDPREVHDFVAERLAAYERERQSCWNRIVRVITAWQSSR